MSARVPFVKSRRGPVTKESWRAFVDRPARERPQREASQSDEQFNRARKRYHSSLGPIATPPMRRIHRELWSLLAANVDADPPRPGAVIDGEANLGKTTILTNYGRLYELDQRLAMAEADDENYDDFVPVVNISLPSNANITALNRRLAMFYGIPGIKYANTDQLTGLICETAERDGTSLFLIDDFHFLKLGRQTHRDVNDHLKDLASSIGATFVFAGVGVEDGELLKDGLREDEASNSQFQGRYEHHKIAPFGLKSEQDRHRWVKLLRSIEAELVLLDAPADVLSGPLAEYLHQRTHGYIGSLSNLIRKAANLAIDRNLETIDEQLLRGVKINYYAQHRPTSKQEKT